MEMGGSISYNISFEVTLEGIWGAIYAVTFESVHSEIIVPVWPPNMPTPCDVSGHCGISRPDIGAGLTAQFVLSS